MEQAAKLILALIFTVSTTVHADCSVNVQPIKKGDVATCDGFLFSDSAEKSAAQSRDDATYYKSLSDKLQQKSDLQDQQSKILDQRIKLYADESNQLAQELSGKSNTEGIYRLLYFGLGVLVTGAIAVNVRR